MNDGNAAAILFTTFKFDKLEIRTCLLRENSRVCGRVLGIAFTHHKCDTEITKTIKFAL